MWINNKKIDLENIVMANGKIIKMEKVPNMRGLGDSSILKCTFENGRSFEIEFMPQEYRMLLSYKKRN